MKYDPARWICQCRPEICDGIFYVYGTARPCPLRDRCLSSARGHQLEYLYPQQSPAQRKLTLAEPERYIAHAKRAQALRRAFAPDAVRMAAKAYYQNKKDQLSAYHAERYRQRHPPGEERPKTQLPPPPCGGDCADGCPYDGVCCYPDWEEEHGAEWKRLERNRRKRERRAAETPEQRESRLAQRREQKKQRLATETLEQRGARLAARRVRDAHYREEKRQREAVETPEQRESRLAQRREKRKQQLAAETPEQREARLAKRREREKQQLATETPEQREVRLAKQRVKDARRRKKKKEGR